MQMTGLMFLFRDSQFFRIVLPAAEASQILDGWHVGSLKEVIGHPIPDPKVPGSPAWLVRVAEVKAMHTFAPEELLAQLQSQPQGPPAAAISGRQDIVRTW
jgi:hypothetical protein